MERTILASDDPFVRKVESIALFKLSDGERAALAALPSQVVEYDPRKDVVTERDRPNCCFTVLDGIASAYKTTEDGHRQVVAYYVPGDMPGLQSLHLTVLDFSISAVTPLRIGSVSHNSIKGLFDAYPRLKGVFWRATVIEDALAREWMLNNGRREALPRLAHLFCELVFRLDRVGLVSNHSCEFRLTQHELADALGITPIHVNRVMQTLRASGLLSLRNARLKIHDWDALTHVADFNPAYLHLRQTDVRQ